MMRRMILCLACAVLARAAAAAPFVCVVITGFNAVAYAVLVTHGPVWDNFARDLVVWAAPRIPAANKGEALRRCLAEVDAATCSRAFADVDPTPLTCVPSY